VIERATELEIINPRQRKYLYQQLSTRGWRKQEPEALDVAIERPRLLRQMAERLYMTGQGQSLDLQLLSNETSLPEQLILDTLKLHSGSVSLPSESFKVIDFDSVRA
jgi:hypothetical protein